jgi:lipoprotein-anchoring transpeptidase ErfK/SrfK
MRAPHRNHVFEVHAIVALLALSAFETAAQTTPPRPKAPAMPIAQISLNAADVNNAALPEAENEPLPPAAVLRAQILLDRAQFSPGEIDAQTGLNFERAIAAFQESRQLAPSGRIDRATWDALMADSAPALVDYTVTEEDRRGPFQPIPNDMMKKAELKELSFSSAAELLGERFHASPQLLEKLNPGKNLSRAGEQLVVPNVSASPLAKASKVVVDESDASVSVLDDTGKRVARFPATMGSRHDPLPIGTWKVTTVEENPPFKYNPKLFWDASPGHSKTMLPPGPNSPVGIVWIDLSKEHYGIHGTPEPAKIGKTQSHGCIRLTNWSAKSLATAVSPGTEVVLQK